VRDAFARAKNAQPCILFFDEFESIAPKRGGDSTGVSDRVVNTLLTAMDGVDDLEGVFVLASSNRPDVIDTALLRPGRLDKWLLCDFPDESERRDIVNVCTRKISVQSDYDLEQIVERTEGFNGADIQSIFSEAQIEEVRRRLEKDTEGGSGAVVLGGESLQMALESARPSLSGNERRRSQALMAKFAGGIDNDSLAGAKVPKVALK